jgi:hypothetical protein
MTVAANAAGTPNQLLEGNNFFTASLLKILAHLSEDRQLFLMQFSGSLVGEEAVNGPSPLRLISLDALIALANSSKFPAAIPSIVQVQTR